MRATFVVRILACLRMTESAAFAGEAVPHPTRIEVSRMADPPAQADERGG